MLGCCPLSPAMRRTTRQFLIYSLSILTMQTRTTAHDSILRQAGKRFPALCLTLAIVACSLMPFASPTAWGGELQDDSRVWGAALTRGNFGYVSPDLKRWLWWMEGQLRARDCCSNGIALDQSLIRPGLGYALTDLSSVWIRVRSRHKLFRRAGRRDRGRQNVGAIYVVRIDAFRQLYLPTTARTTLASKRQRYELALSSISQILLADLFPSRYRFRGLG